MLSRMAPCLCVSTHVQKTVLEISKEILPMETSTEKIVSLADTQMADAEDSSRTCLRSY